MLWLSRGTTPYGNPLGSVTVVAATKAEAISKARESLEAARGSATYVPMQSYLSNLLENLETSIERVGEDVFIDYAPGNSRRG